MKDFDDVNGFDSGPNRGFLGDLMFVPDRVLGCVLVWLTYWLCLGPND